MQMHGTFGLMAAAFASMAALTSSVAGSKDWNLTVGDRMAACGCAAECECTVDIFGPDLAGSWAKDCVQHSAVITFDQAASPARVFNGESYCRLVTVIDYIAMERYYFVRDKGDCSGDASAALAAAYRFDSSAHRLIAIWEKSEAQLSNCGEAR